MAYRHGVYVDEAETSIVSIVEIDASLPVVFGTAPVHNLTGDTAVPVGVPKLIYSKDAFESAFGAVSDDESTQDFTLSEFADVFIGRYGLAPVVFVNVFDPSKHVVSEDDSTPDVSKVGTDDILGAIDLVNKVYPLFRKVPGLLLAPKFSATSAVNIALAAASTGISGMFKAMAISDMPDDGKTITDHTEAPAFITDNNLGNANSLVFFGSPVYNDAEECGSTHLASCIAKRDSENGDIPFWSPSNYAMLCEGINFNGEELALAIDEAANLNGNGIVTGINAVGSLVIWGDQTSIYPTVTDVKDASIPVRRMFNWISNKIILTIWQKVSFPLRRRLINSICDTLNCWLNGLTAKEAILGGRVEFMSDDNPTTNLLDGKIQFRVYVTPPTAAKEIIFIMEYDVSYLETLFS